MIAPVRRVSAKVRAHCRSKTLRIQDFRIVDYFVCVSHRTDRYRKELVYVRACELHLKRGEPR